MSAWELQQTVNEKSQVIEDSNDIRLFLKNNQR